MSGWNKCLFVLLICILGEKNVFATQGNIFISVTVLVQTKILGLVVESDKTPINGAEVELFSNGTITKKTKTNKNGEFSFLDLKTGDYWIKTTATGFPPTTVNIKVIAGANSIVIVLSPLIPKGDVISYPQPATGDFVTFLYYLEEPSHISIKVYNVALNLIAQIEEDKDSSWQKTVWNIKSVAQGILIYQVEARGQSGKTIKFPIKKLAIIK